MNDTKLRDVATSYLEQMIIAKNSQVARIRALESYKDSFLRGKMTPGGKWNYCVYKKSVKKHKYLGNDDNEEVRKIKEFRYLDSSLRRINHNIELIENLLNQVSETDYDSINSSLPKTYRNPKVGSTSSLSKAASWKERADAYKKRYDAYRPEELNIRTNDGNYVRSKSEAMIYNYLLSVGAAFIYEMPIRIDGRTMIPDFTLLSESNFETEIIIEHQGMMNNEAYRNRFAEKVYRYLRGGYVQGINIFYTFDNADGGFDMTPIEDIVVNHVKDNNLKGDSC